MARIPVPTIESAPEKTRPMMEALKKKLGMTPNLFATIGWSPESLEMLLGGIEKLAGGKLGAKEIEAINLYVSELNGCAYCVSAHAALGKRAGYSAEEVEAIRGGRAGTVRERAILELARRVVRTGGAGAGSELAAAREAGLSDAEVIEVLAHVALKAFTNAVALVAQTEIDFPKPARLPSP
jgi:uncharacterized peroxidase-related enzyme